MCPGRYPGASRGRSADRGAWAVRIGLFCAGDVGLEVARLVGRRGLPLALAAHDAHAPGAAVEELRALWSGTAVVSSADLDRDGPDLVRRADLDLIVLAWWPYLLPDALRLAPRRGCLNFHPSLLPHNRGKHPNFWALVEGRPFGVSIHWLGDRIDAGPVAFQRELPVTWEDTGGTLHEKARAAAAALFADSADRIWAGDIPARAQPLADGSFHLGREIGPASRIDLDRPTTARELLTLLRARTYPPHPAAWFEADGVRYEVRVQITGVSA